MSDRPPDILDLPIEVREYLINNYLEKDLLNIVCCCKEYYTSLKYLLWQEVHIPWESIQEQSLLPNNLEDNLKWTSFLHFFITPSISGADPSDLWNQVAENYTKILKYCDVRTLLRLKINTIFTNIGIEITVGVCKKLQELIFVNCCDIGVSGWEQLAHLKKLKKLDLKNCFIRNSGVEVLVDIKYLEELHLNTDLKDNIFITNASINHISHISHLKKLTISFNDELDITNKTFSCIWKLHNLLELSLEQTLLHDDSLTHLSKSKYGKKLKKLNIKGCKQITDNGLNLLSNLTSLVELNINGCDQITDKGLLPLSKLTSLVKVYLPDIEFSDPALEEYCKTTGMREMLEFEPYKKILTKTPYFWLKNGKCGWSWKCNCTS